MSSDDERQADLLRQLEAVINGAGLDDLRALTNDLLLLGGQASERRGALSRPELRRPSLPDLHVFRVRVDLKHSKPPIWRRLEVRSDLTLDVVHKVLQAAFGWMDSHLWRFALGGDAFDLTSQIFLCPWDEDEGELDDEGGIPASAVRLDEVLQVPGDVLSYVYDYGDHWELTLRLEDVCSATPDIASAVAIDGRRAAPPEDCGSRRTAGELAEVLDDPAHFDIEELNSALRSPFMLLTECGLDRRMVDLASRLAFSPLGEDLTSRALALMSDPGPPSEQELQKSFSAFRWFLDRAADKPIQLTAAGYLKPVDVEEAARVIPSMGDWVGKANREIETYPVLNFRELLQGIGLLRKYKGTLRLTRAGARARSAPEELWNFLADKLAATKEGFDTEATLFLLVYSATSAEAEMPLDMIAAALNHLGWRVNGTDPVERHDLYGLPALQLLENITDTPAQRRRRAPVSPAAARIARASLMKR